MTRSSISDSTASSSARADRGDDDRGLPRRQRRMDAAPGRRPRRHERRASVAGFRSSWRDAPAPASRRRSLPSRLTMPCLMFVSHGYFGGSGRGFTLPMIVSRALIRSASRFRSRAAGRYDGDPALLGAPTSTSITTVAPPSLGGRSGVRLRRSAAASRRGGRRRRRRSGAAAAPKDLHLDAARIVGKVRLSRLPGLGAAVKATTPIRASPCEAQASRTNDAAASRPASPTLGER